MVSSSYEHRNKDALQPMRLGLAFAGREPETVPRVQESVLEHGANQTDTQHTSASRFAARQAELRVIRARDRDAWKRGDRPRGGPYEQTWVASSQRAGSGRPETRRDRETGTQERPRAASSFAASYPKKFAFAKSSSGAKFYPRRRRGRRPEATQRFQFRSLAFWGRP